MKYFEPTSIDEAVAILAREDDALVEGKWCWGTLGSFREIE